MRKVRISAGAGPFAPFAPVAQWIERRPPKPEAAVRVRSGVPLGLERLHRTQPAHVQPEPPEAILHEPLLAGRRRPHERALEPFAARGREVLHGDAGSELEGRADHVAVTLRPSNRRTYSPNSGSTNS